MSLFRTANAPVVATYEASKNFTKCAFQADMTPEDDQSVRKTINLVSPELLNAVASAYDISSNIDDYIFVVPRAVTANIPNGNADRFTHDELTRFDVTLGCQVYETFRNDPLHVEHAAEDPKTARGFLPDVHYVTSDPNDMHVLAVCAMDTTKDPAFANAYLSGTANAFSMGCICQAVKCSHCGGTAYSDADMCSCLQQHKGFPLNGSIVYEDCLGVTFKELSGVGDPADPKALTQAILRHSSQIAELSATAQQTLISRLLAPADQVEFARFVQDNVNSLPQSVVTLANKLF